MKKNRIPEWGGYIYCIEKSPVSTANELPEAIERLAEEKGIKLSQVLIANYFTKRSIKVKSLTEHPTKPEEYVVINENVPGERIDYPLIVDKPSKLDEDIFYGDAKDADTECERRNLASRHAIKSLVDFLTTQDNFVENLIKEGIY